MRSAAMRDWTSHIRVEFSICATNMLTSALYPQWLLAMVTQRRRARALCADLGDEALGFGVHRRDVASMF